MEEFFAHSALLDQYDLSAVLVMQEGVQPVPLSRWLPAAAQHLGGHALVGQQLYIYWYGQVRRQPDRAEERAVSGMSSSQRLRLCCEGMHYSS